ncbi:hypothetical protein N9D23_13985 [Rubripirellula sp.]|nr:hypothetical protein [Rubripirellula sp.]
MKRRFPGFAQKIPWLCSEDSLALPRRFSGFAPAAKPNRHEFAYRPTDLPTYRPTDLPTYRKRAYRQLAC